MHMYGSNFRKGQDASATIQQFNARFAGKRRIWAWPTIAAALTSKHHWLVIACDSCGTVIDLDLRVKPRDPDASIRVALDDVRGPAMQRPWADTHRPSWLTVKSGSNVRRIKTTGARAPLDRRPARRRRFALGTGVHSRSVGVPESERPPRGGLPEIRSGASVKVRTH